MINLVPLKIKILQNDDGSCKYPELNNITAANRGNVDWTKYIDKFGGWHYDKTSGHAEETVGSPLGEWHGLVFMPTEFAKEAVSLFPETCSELPEVEAEEFYNTKAHVKDPEENIDIDVVTGIKLKQDLGLTLTTDQTKAIDPNDDTVGITKNKRKVFADFKVVAAITVVKTIDDVKEIISK